MEKLIKEVSKETLQHIIESAEKELEERDNQYMMKVTAGHSDLVVWINDTSILKLSLSSKMQLYKGDIEIDLVNKWYKAGMKVQKQDPVDFNAGVYKIREKVLERVDIDNGHIYDFEYMTPIPRCKDTNVKRYANRTPIVY